MSHLVLRPLAYCRSFGGCRKKLPGVNIQIPFEFSRFNSEFLYNMLRLMSYLLWFQKHLSRSQYSFAMTQIWGKSQRDQRADLVLRTARKERPRYCPYKAGMDSRITSIIAISLHPQTLFDLITVFITRSSTNAWMVRAAFYTSPLSTNDFKKLSLPLVLIFPRKLNGLRLKPPLKSLKRPILLPLNLPLSRRQWQAKNGTGHPPPAAKTPKHPN